MFQNIGHEVCLAKALPCFSVTIGSAYQNIANEGTAYAEPSDTLATSNACVPTATGLFKMRLRGAGYNTLGYAGPLLSAANLYYFAITCLNNSSTEIRSCVSSTNPFTKSNTADLPQPMGSPDTTSTSVWMAAY